MKVDKSTWAHCKLVDVCKTYQPKTIAVKALRSTGDFFVYGANGIIGKHDEYNHESQEVIVGCRGTCGVVHITRPKSWINGNAMVIHPNNPAMFDIDFLYYLVKSVDYSKVITGVAQPQITRANLSKVIIDVPSIETQSIIASELKTLQEVIAGYREQIADLDALARSLFLDTFGDPVTNPKGWEVKQFSDCVEIGKKKGAIAKANYNNGSIYPIISQDKDYISGYSDDSNLVFWVKSPVIIFGDHTRVFKYIDFDFCIGADGVKILIPQKNMVAYYLFYNLLIQGVESNGYSRHYKFLEQKSIIVPPIELQQGFAEQVEAIEKQKELLRQQLADAEMLLAERMQYYFS